ALRIGGYGNGSMDERVGGDSAIAPESGDAGAAVAGEGVDHALRVDDTHAVVAGVGNVQVALRIERHADGGVELGGGGGSAIAGEARARVADDECHRA